MTLPLSFRGLIEEASDKVIATIDKDFIISVKENFHLEAAEVAPFGVGVLTGWALKFFRDIYKRQTNEEELREIVGLIKKRSNEIYDKVASLGVG